jgi:O-methyltransferase involved in polyketide biosynthesis
VPSLWLGRYFKPTFFLGEGVAYYLKEAATHDPRVVAFARRVIKMQSLFSR